MGDSDLMTGSERMALHSAARDQHTEFPSGKTPAEIRSVRESGNGLSLYSTHGSGALTRIGGREPECPERDSNPHALSDNGF
jgi:hypothetical protein